MHGQSPASPEGGRYLSRVGGGVVALGQTGERHPWISFFFPFLLDSDQNCEHYTSAWVLDCVLDCICHQMSTLHAAEP